jgi:hypothetical protein
VRIREHRYNLKQGLIEKSKLAQHAYEEDHRVSWDEVRVLSLLEGLLLFRESGQGFCDFGETGNKSPVVRALAQKAYKFVLILWGCPFSHSFQFFRVGTLLLSVKVDNFPG